MVAAAAPSTPSLRSVQFRKEREGIWHELEQLIELVNKEGIRELTADQLARLRRIILVDHIPAAYIVDIAVAVIIDPIA